MYRRHENCRCVVEYDPGDGKRQNVHTKRWTDPKRIEERKETRGVDTTQRVRAVSPQRLEAENVTAEYLRNARPAQGSMTREQGYRESRHAAEIRMAQWLHDNLGGDIVLLNESAIKEQMTADYLWRGKLWELKGVTSVNSADKMLRHALKQIAENPGGVIIDITNRTAPPEQLYSQMFRRFLRSDLNNVDVLILDNDTLQKILRYKK